MHCHEIFVLAAALKGSNLKDKQSNLNHNNSVEGQHSHSH